MRRFVGGGVMGVVLLSVVLVYIMQPRLEVPTVQTTTDSTVPLHQSYSRDASLYAVTATSSYTQRFAESAAGGVVSHHLLANIDIARFFAEFSDQSVCRVVIVGPNHYFPHDDMVVSTRVGYTTPFGEVPTDVRFVDALVSRNIATIKEQTVEEEHAISSLVPYIAAYFPHATVVPLLLNQKFDTEALDELAAAIKEQSNDCTIVVASVDFSHHLYSNMVDLHDRRSIAAFTQFDSESLAKVEVDSRSALYVAGRYFLASEAKRIEYERQSAAAIFNEYDSEDVTSYVFAHALPGDSITEGGVSMLFFGDMMLGRGVADTPGLWSGIIGPEGNFMKGYDAVIGNIEGALERPGCSAEDDDLLISGEILRSVRQRGVTHGGVMNNHFLRCPYDVAATELFADAGMIPVTNTPVVIKGTNKEVATIALYASPVPDDVTQLIEQVASVPKDETLVVYIHWGVEYATNISERERDLAHALIDVGADAIIGHHPHVVQPIEIYNNAPIFYSLGNLFSDQVGSATRTGLAVGMWQGISERLFYLFPYTNVNGVPTHMTQYDARQFCDEIYNGQREYVSSVHPCILQFR
jgi:AmmeMemoRadiSam system protein B